MCLYPKIILNPVYSCRRDSFSYVDMNGTHFPPRPYFSAFHHGAVVGKEDNLSSFFAVDSSTGETVPVFLSVPCRKCTQCLEQRRSSIKSRMLLEQYFQGDDYPPVHLTLTYREGCVPSTGVSRSDLVLFLNRFKTYAKRNGYFHPIRHAGFSEYGSDDRYSHRPHYHVILFGIPRTDGNPDAFRKLVSVIRSAWKFGGFHLSFPPVNKLAYVCKYALKDSLVPPPAGLMPNFYTLSVHGGGLGCPTGRAHEIVALFGGRKRAQIKVLGTVVNISIPSNVLDKVKPTFSNLCSSEFTRNLRLLSNVTYTLVKHYSENRASEYVMSLYASLFPKYAVSPQPYYFGLSYRPFNYKPVDLLQTENLDYFRLIDMAESLYRYFESYQYDCELFLSYQRYYVNFKRENEDYFESCRLYASQFYLHPDEWESYNADCFRKHATLPSTHSLNFDDYADL